VEFMDPENANLLPPGLAEALVTPQILSHLLAQVALRRELRAVFEGLFGSGGAEIPFRSAASYGLVGQHMSSVEIHQTSLLHGDIAIGVRLASAASRNGGVALNPPRACRWEFGERDEVVVVSTCLES